MIKGILFNTDMVRAILNGRKTVTRRVVKPKPKKIVKNVTSYDYKGGLIAIGEIDGRIYEQAVAPYRPGDILYVRETWAKCSCSAEIEKQESPDFYWPKSVACDACRPHMGEDNPYVKWIDRKDGAIDYGCYLYKSDLDGEEAAYRKWRPSIHMPKEAARLFLRVTKVSVERLQAIKNDQAVEEGAVRKPNYTKRGDLVLHNRYRKEFSELWDITIKKADRALYGWDANPWVWVIEFERISKEEAMQ